MDVFEPPPQFSVFSEGPSYQVFDTAPLQSIEKERPQDTKKRAVSVLNGGDGETRERLVARLRARIEAKKAK